LLNGSFSVELKNDLEFGIQDVQIFILRSQNKKIYKYFAT